jgi:hypothetical protein
MPNERTILDVLASARITSPFALEEIAHSIVHALSLTIEHNFLRRTRIALLLSASRQSGRHN